MVLPTNLQSLSLSSSSSSSSKSNNAAEVAAITPYPVGLAWVFGPMGAGAHVYVSWQMTATLNGINGPPGGGNSTKVRSFDMTERRAHFEKIVAELYEKGKALNVVS